MRLVFAGTPAPAVPALEALLASRHEVVGVVTRPDARAGRGRKLIKSPVAQVAESAGLPLLQPVRAGDPEFLTELAALEPDVCPVVAYGALLPEAALVIPRWGWVNLHFSLLPAWRGAAPVQHAIRHGDSVTGASTVLIEQGLDTGPVFGVVTEAIDSRDTSADLLSRLAESGAGLLVATMDGIDDGQLAPVPQSTDGVSQAPKLTVADAQIVWSQPAMAVDRVIRSCTPDPGAWTTLAEQRVKVFPVAVARTAGAEVSTPDAEAADDAAPGELTQVGKHRWLVGTGTTAVELGDVQPQGKKRMRAADWLRGQRVESGVRFS